MGINWSRTKKRAMPYEGDLGSTFIRFCGVINPDSIDYLETIVKNVSVTYGSFEDETILTRGSEVLIHRVELLDGQGELIESFDLPELRPMPA